MKDMVYFEDGFFEKDIQAQGSSYVTEVQMT